MKPGSLDPEPPFFWFVFSTALELYILPMKPWIFGQEQNLRKSEILQNVSIRTLFSTTKSQITNTIPSHRRRNGCPQPHSMLFSGYNSVTRTPVSVSVHKISHISSVVRRFFTLYNYSSIPGLKQVKFSRAFNYDLFFPKDYWSLGHKWFMFFT